MDGSLWNYWGQHDMSSLCFGLGNDMEHNRTRFQQQQVSKEFESKFPFTEPSIYVEHSTPHHHNVPRRPHEEDQVVPSFQRLTVLEGQHRDPCKPLPPLPDPEELMSDEAADSEVEFFTCSDRRRLLPKGYSKAPCYGSPTRGSSFKDFGQVNYGQVNYAYQDSSCSASSSSGGGADCKAHFWASAADDSSAARGCVAADSGTSAGVNSWTIGGVNYRSQRGQQCQKEHDSEQMMTAVREITASKLPDCHMQPSRRRFSYSGPTHHHHHPQSLSTPCATDKPEVPPRIPIRPKPSTLSKTIADEWSLSNEQDKPPKIPPRVPLVPVCPPRTPSPKSLPLYVNGVMPATQSFAPNPKYVSRAQQRQQSERAPPADQCSPCIVPIMKDGRQASTTHYFLLPGRPAYMGRLERLLSEPDRKDNTGTEWSCQNR